MSLSRITKRLTIVRHGQAMHNPRAEAQRHAGCSYERFLEIMKEDDVLDAGLTDLGISQAKMAHKKLQSSLFKMKTSERDENKSSIELVVSSPLSRALHTADTIFPPSSSSSVDNHKRICVESFREINGWLLNAKRRSKKELQNDFSSWDFSLLSSETDETWTPELESQSSCAERGYQGLLWILNNRPEQNILLVAHGGLLRFTMYDHPDVSVSDKRSTQSEKRFENCEIRHFEISCCQRSDCNVEDSSYRPKILLNELELNAI